MVEDKGGWGETIILLKWGFFLSGQNIKNDEQL